jgi:hypothetical protein
MKIALAVLVVALIAFAWRLNSMKGMLGDKQQQIQTLKSASAEKSTQEALTLQTQCAETARRYLSARGWKPGDGDYKNHFNSKLKKCFVLVSGYLLKEDFVTIDLYDAVEGRHYATFNGHNICDVAITKAPRKCSLDSGSIWFDGDDTRHPADFIAGFRGLLYGGGSGDETTQKTFLDHIQPFMSE